MEILWVLLIPTAMAFLIMSQASSESVKLSKKMSLPEAVPQQPVLPELKDLPRKPSVWRYLKEAFIASPRVPGVGRIPVNPLLAAGLGAMGFVNPLFWLGLVGTEAIWLGGLTGSRRFRNWVDGKFLLSRSARIARQLPLLRNHLVRTLRPELQDKWWAHEKKTGRLKELYRSTQSNPSLAEENQRALTQLGWTYFKHLLARDRLTKADAARLRSTLSSQIGAMEKELQVLPHKDSVRASREATVRLLKERLAHWNNVTDVLHEINADLQQIETQVDLALDNAILRDEPPPISERVHLAADLSEGSYFADSEREVLALDEAITIAQGASGGMVSQ